MRSIFHLDSERRAALSEVSERRDPARESPDNIRFAAQEAVWQQPELTEEQVTEKIRQAFDPPPYLVTAESDGNGTFWVIVVPEEDSVRIQFTVYIN
jgi:hypothetical protein